MNARMNDGSIYESIRQLDHTITYEQSTP